jgi:hypothetical protein
VKLADTADSKSAEGNFVSVQVRPRPPYLLLILESISVTIHDEHFTLGDPERNVARLACDVFHSYIR